MDLRRVLPLVAVWLTMVAATHAFDRVKTTSSTITGMVTEMSALEVTVEVGAARKQFPVNEIEVISYDNEPTLLKTARTAVAAGRYEDALAALGRIDVAGASRPEIVQDIEFYGALAASRLALAGGADVKQAGRRMVEFVNKSSGNYHYLAACEVVGDLLVADQKYALAATYYEYLAKAPWPDYKMRANVAVGRAQLAGGQPADALKAFEAALAVDGGAGPAASGYRLTATLGKARCLAEIDQTDEAVKLAQDVIDRADPENSDLQADAYNALGIALRKAGRPKDALLAFLHVDVLYFTSSRQHIEALENLDALWKEIGQPQRAAEVARTLEERYKVSPKGQ